MPVQCHVLTEKPRFCVSTPLAATGHDQASHGDVSLKQTLGNTLFNLQHATNCHHVQAEEDTKGRDEAAVKEREAAAAKAQEDAKRRQQEAAHNDAVLGFQTLLAELVKDPYAQWKVRCTHTHPQTKLGLPMSTD